MQPKIYLSEDHHIHNDLIDPNALYILQKLREAGHLAYLVGGGVRDLLMRKKPKDFDISTSAHPEQIKQLFRSCILIGRRFRLAHIRFGKEVIEVSTFRKGDNTEGDLIIRDNEWGSPEEDVLRRDFTINGLYYDPVDHRIIDYVGGMEDLKAHLLRSIGDPNMRFRQDPVRMIRLMKFHARFGFNIDPYALEALKQLREEITKSSPARVLEEIFRMLESGASELFFRQLVDYKFLHVLFPHLDAHFHNPVIQTKLYSFLKGIDEMNIQGRKTLDRAILTAALLFPILDAEVRSQSQDKEPPLNLGDIMHMANEMIHNLLFEAFSHFPRKIRYTTHYILYTQYRLTPLNPKKGSKSKITRQKEFPLALNFLKLRALLDHIHLKSYSYWKRAYETPPTPKKSLSIEQKKELILPPPGALLETETQGEG